MRLLLNKLGLRYQRRLVEWPALEFSFAVLGPAGNAGMRRGLIRLSSSLRSELHFAMSGSGEKRLTWVTATEPAGGMLILAPLSRPVRIPAMPSPHSQDHPLRQTWPAFLDVLEKDIAQAKHEFAVFAYRLLQSRPPRILQSQTTEEREDWIQEIILHFTDDDCRVLREYRNTGHPFAAWFITVVNHKAYDFYRKAGTYRDRTASTDDKPDDIGHPDPSDPADIRAEFGEIIVRVTACIRKMSRKCQILLQAAAEEYNPREMLTLLGADAGTNKQAADDLRACRKRLKALLAEDGIELNRYLS
jgi:DNA-directed RNA polymerase specialized sigma24 family protein